ncbi:hypothetical protein CI109_105117 [Kwoniella shandongensis]|uniref:Uncharacterized protein n=1 Tax=Kwoniella shandongensis TaxID=1734106 RepID=A0A5M6C413_9TREE|nr:uncharacterized protein CI109_001956 [Kwoniella shandongensis]KAA5529531.1 hypothetical protein CI109_001956 [Kwoniella shandongensis]
MDHNLLVSELQALSVETKRRNPEVRDASEAALELLKGGALGKEILHQNADTLLEPITLGCKTKIAKVIGISIAALQRLVALGGVPTVKLPQVLTTLTSVANQAVDIQLRILQTLLSILTFNKDVHDEVLGTALLLCFKLQDSRVSVVSSTAAATLRQAVMLIFDRVSTDPSPSSSSSETTLLPLTFATEPPTELHISPSAMDTFNIFSDLCLLTASAGSHGSSFSLWGGGEKEKPRLLKLNTLHRTFGLELIESILSGYEEGVKQRPELLFLLQNSLDTLLLKLLAEKPTFPIALRVCRLIFLLIRSFTDQLPKQVETYLIALIKMGMGDSEGEEGKGKEVPPWLRVLALEILRGICGDPKLLQNIYAHYDQADGPGLFNKLVSSLSRLVNEKPALLGIGNQMHGLGIPNTDPTSPGATSHAGYLDMGLGMVASAASVGVSTMNAMIGSAGGGLGPQSSMKQKLIDQHDKAEAPLVPETYIYLLALQSLDAIAQGVYTTVAQSDITPTIVRDMASSSWPALLAALSYCIATNLSDTIFSEVLTALQDFTIACGLLELNTPRDAFLSTLGKYAVPPPVVSAMQTHLEAPNSQRNVGGIAADALGFSALGVGGATGPPSLSERNMACLRSTVNTARVLGPTLGEAWHDVLEILQNANFMFAARKPTISRRPTEGSPGVPSTPGALRTINETTIAETKPDILKDLDPESIQLLVNALFDSSRDLPDDAFTTFITALCQLSAEMIGLDAKGSIVVDLTDHSVPSTPTMALSPSQDQMRRRTSGINISHSIKSGERSFSLTKLRVVSTLNMSRIVTKEPEVGWKVITQHLLAVARHLTAPSTIRTQASDTLGELLLSSVRIGKDSRIQHQVFDVLVRQVDVNPVSFSVSTDYDVRSSGYQTLNHLLESSGHALSVGWATIFGMLDDVCKESEEPASQSLQRADSSASSTFADPRRPSMFSRGNANLVRIAFPSLTLICTDFLTSLDADSMRRCIACLGCFGRQREDVNITLAAIGLLWNVSDAVQGDSKELWLYLLTELLELGRDSRLEVRSSAMQTLFRCVELYGFGLSPDLWQDVFGKVIFPLLDAAQSDESQVLALTSVGAIFGSFLSSIAKLESFDEIYQRFLDKIYHAFANEPRPCCTAALKALEKVLVAVEKGVEGNTASVVNATWETFVQMGKVFVEGEPYTQDNLVALVRIASLLHDQLSTEQTERLSQLSAILRSIMTYTRSPEYRPDNDTMSPLQQSISNLVSRSKSFGANIVLGDLAEFSSLAYMGVGEQSMSSKLTYVALSKWAMPKMGEVLEKKARDKTLYEDGTVESVLGAYSIPIKLKYDCPAPNRFGDDPPLWRTAMITLVSVLDLVIATLDVETIVAERFEGIWAQIMEIFSGILLAESSEEVTPEDETFVIDHLTQITYAVLPRLGDTRIPDRINIQFSEVLRKASRIYHYDVRLSVGGGGTTAPGIPEHQEGLRYWALDLLVTAATKGEPGENGSEKERRVAGLTIPALMKRFEEPMERFLDDKRLRGQLPLGRAREEEVLYILRHLATMRVWEGSMSSTKPGSDTLAAVYKTSSRSHLFHFYPLLLEFSFIQNQMPSMWIFPSEQAKLFDLPSLSQGENDEVDAGDGGDLIEVNARELARRCLELIGVEMGLGAYE